MQVEGNAIWYLSPQMFFLGNLGSLLGYLTMLKQGNRSQKRCWEICFFLHFKINKDS